VIIMPNGADLQPRADPSSTSTAATSSLGVAHPGIHARTQDPEAYART